MEEGLYFKEEKLHSFNELIYKFNVKEFKSPYRSTIPLLALYKAQPYLHFGLASDTEAMNAKYTFEFETHVTKGKGLPSCTDLMIEYSSTCIAVEAKWTEPPYSTVKQWLGESSNKRQVLEGWLEMISSFSGIILHYDTVAGLPYQLIHRVASACSLKRANTNVVYLCFNLSDTKKEYYYQNLKLFSQILGNNINLYLGCFEILKLERQNILEANWRNGSRNLSEHVLKGLIDNSLMSISQLTFEKINC
jgi:hypothetical protein